jgi:hypothetical protein
VRVRVQVRGLEENAQGAGRSSQKREGTVVSSFEARRGTHDGVKSALTRADRAAAAPDPPRMTRPVTSKMTSQFSPPLGPLPCVPR